MPDSTATEAMHPPGPVDLTTIRVVHARLLARYGSAWRAKFANISAETVEKDWFHELQRLPLWAFDYGLDNLPVDFPPTAGQFREICRRAPAPIVRQRPRIGAPRPDPVRLRTVFERMHEVAKDRGPTDWIGDLEARQAGGERLSMFQLSCLENARANLSHRQVDDVRVSTEDSRRTDELKRATAARVAAYLREHPELQP